MALSAAVRRRLWLTVTSLGDLLPCGLMRASNGREEGGEGSAAKAKHYAQSLVVQRRTETRSTPGAGPCRITPLVRQDAPPVIPTVPGHKPSNTPVKIAACGFLERTANPARIMEQGEKRANLGLMLLHNGQDNLLVPSKRFEHKRNCATRQAPRH